MNNSAQILNKNIEKLLNENRLMGREPSNQTELARLMGVSIQAVHKSIKGKITLKTLDSLAKALKTTPARLILRPADMAFVDVTIGQLLDIIQTGLQLKIVVKDEDTIARAISLNPSTSLIPLDSD